MIAANRILDLIYDFMDDLMRKGEFEALDLYLAGIDSRNLSIETMLAMLTAILPARNCLPSRKALFQKIEMVKDRRELEDGLLVGLE